MKRILIFLILCAHLSADEKQIAIWLNGSRTSTSWREFYEGVDQAAKEWGTVPIIYGEYDSDMQNAAGYLEEGAAKGADAFILSIADPISMDPAISEIVKKKIPVIAVHAGYFEFAKLGIAEFIGENPTQAGRETAQRLLDKGVTRLLCVRDDLPDISINRRIDAVKKLFKENGKIVDILRISDYSPSTSLAKIATHLIVNETYDGILSLGETTAIPVIMALKQIEKYGKIHFATFDLVKDVQEGLESRQIEFAVSQQPFMQGYLSMSIASSPETDLKTHFENLKKFKGDFFPSGTMAYESYENPGPITYTGPIFITE